MPWSQKPWHWSYLCLGPSCSGCSFLLSTSGLVGKPLTGRCLYSGRISLTLTRNLHEKKSKHQLYRHCQVPINAKIGEVKSAQKHMSGFATTRPLRFLHL